MNKGLVIHVLANDGSPLGVTERSIYGLDGGVGVGGAELAILTLCRAWKDIGHKVIFYNDPRLTDGSTFPQMPKSFFNPKEFRDILIIFRSPNDRIKDAVGKKVWLSTDQYTVGNFADFAKQVDKIVTISPFHQDYFNSTYGISDTVSIDLPVRVWEYEEQVPRIENKLIFCSVPDRGLGILAEVYDQLKSKIPELTLTITSDYRLWGVSSPMNEGFLKKFLGKSGVRFLGAVPRGEMIMEQLSSEIHAYPCTYSELFCYSSAECQVAGTYPITSGVGSLSTTNMGTIIQGDPNSREWKTLFVESIIHALSNRKIMQEHALENQEIARHRFSLKRILKEWDESVFND